MLALAMCAASAAPPGRQSDEEEPQWGSYGGDPGGNRHSPLTQINREQRRAAEDRVDLSHRRARRRLRARRQAHVRGDADPRARLAVPQHADEHRDRARPGHRRRNAGATTRGSIARRALLGSDFARRVVVDRRDRRSRRAPCAHRILMGTLDARLIALDGRTGRPCRDFGNGGTVDLAAGVRDGHERGNYLVTSPPAIYRDIVIVGSAIGDNRAVELRARHRARIRRAQRQAAVVVGSDSDDRRGSDAARLDSRSRRSAPAPRTHGRSCRSTPAAAWCSCPPARRARTSSAASAPATTAYANSLVALHAETGAARLASPARASRPVGLRRAGAADADRHRARRQIDPGRCPGDEDRHAVRLRPRDRRAGVRGRRAARAAVGRRRRSRARRRNRFPRRRRSCRTRR